MKIHAHLPSWLRTLPETFGAKQAAPWLTVPIAPARDRMIQPKEGFFPLKFLCRPNELRPVLFAAHLDIRTTLDQLAGHATPEQMTRFILAAADSKDKKIRETFGALRDGNAPTDTLQRVRMPSINGIDDLIYDDRRVANILGGLEAAYLAKQGFVDEGETRLQGKHLRAFERKFIESPKYQTYARSFDIKSPMQTTATDFAALGVYYFFSR